MQNVKRPRSVALSFLLLMLPLLSSAKAQSQSSAPRLEGTTWRAESVIPVNGNVLDIKSEFRFAEEGKVSVDASWRMFGMRPRPQYNPISGRLEVVYTEYGVISESSGKFLGTYKLNGSLIHLECDNISIDATVNGNRIDGDIIFNKSKGKVIAERISAGTNIVNLPGSKDLLATAHELLKQGKYREAIDNYTAAIRLNLGEVDKLFVYSNRGYAKLALKDYQGAIADCEQFFRLRRGGAGLSGFEPRNGPNDFYTSDAYDSLFATVLNNRGVAKGQLGDKVGACEDFRDACEIFEFNSSKQTNGIGCENFKKVCK